MPSTEITLISDGPEVYAHFADANDPKSVDMVYTGRTEYDLFERTTEEGVSDWRDGKNPLFSYATDPAKALEWLLANGWQAHSEEQDFLDGKGWPK